MKVTTDSILLGAWADVSGAQRMLDIGTGSGILAMLIAQKSIGTIDAIDVSEQACRLAKKNFQQSKWRERLHVYHLSAQAYYCTDEYDVIISNPPYFTNSLQAPDSHRNLARHMVELSYRELTEAVQRMLKKDGKFYVSIPAISSREFKREANNSGLYVTRQLMVQSTAAKTAYLYLLCLEKMAKETECDTLIIQTKNGTYTHAFREWTKECYV